MSVCIKGMEMPKSCSCCPFRKSVAYILLDWAGCQLNEDIYKTKAFEGRHKDCPLIEVKTPHGDLIERVPTITKIQKIEEEPQYQHDGEDWINGLIQAEEVVRYAPTVLEAEDIEDEGQTD